VRRVRWRGGLRGFVAVEGCYVVGDVVLDVGIGFVLVRLALALALAYSLAYSLCWFLVWFCLVLEVPHGLLIAMVPMIVIPVVLFLKAQLFVVVVVVVVVD